MYRRGKALKKLEESTDYLENVRMKCISCNKCKKACPFLNKYDLDLKEYTDRVDLAYNCFMCGKCKSVCPMSLDGKKISIILRAEKGKVGSNLVKDYFPFKNNVKKVQKVWIFIFLDVILLHSTLRPTLK